MLTMNRTMNLASILSTAIVAVVAVAVTGCVTMESTPEAEEEIQSANFAFTPPSEATPGSSQVTLLQITPQFIDTFEYPQVEPFSGFASSMESDVQELLAARGFTARGPFETTEEVVYADKEQSDFYLRTNLGLNVDISSVGVTEEVSLASLINSDDESNYRFVGDIRLGGQIRLAAYETLTSERLWVKTIDLPGKTVGIDGNDTFSRDEFVVALQRDAGVRNPVTVALEEYYQTFMTATWDYLAPTEMSVLKAQADKLKERKRY